MEYIIVFAPLLGALVATFSSNFLKDKQIQIITRSLVLLSAILSLIIFYQTLFNGYTSNNLIFNWITTGNFNVNWSIYIDPLTSVMLVVVSLISSLIHF